MCNALGANRLNVSLSNWMGEVSCEVLALPLLLEMPNKDGGSCFGMQKDIFA